MFYASKIFLLEARILKLPQGTITTRMQLLQLKISFACHSNLLCDGLPAVVLLMGLQ